MNQNLTFEDRLGRKWDLFISLATAKRIEQSDFSALTSQKITLVVPNQKILTEILMNGPLTFAVIWAIVQPQIEKNGVKTEEEFLDGFDGDSVKRGKETLWGAITDFFPEHQTELDTLKEQYRIATEKLNNSLSNMTGILQETIDLEIAQNETNLKEKLRTSRLSNS